jgi:DNA-binding transcriptional ArsR family regulator
MRGRELKRCHGNVSIYVEASVVQDEGRMSGDTDIAAVGALVANPGRSRILLALDDGRALPAGRLALEAGVSAATASSHLAKLTDAGLLTVEPHGRFRYYRLAGPEVGALIEALQRVPPRRPIRSLRQGTRAKALRDARTCYDHLAGRLGVGVMSTLIERGYLIGGDGRYDPATAQRDQRTGYGHDVDYALSQAGARFLDQIGVQIASGRTAVRYCIDWSEQRHHLAGAVGRGLRDRLIELEWIVPAASSRAVRVTDAGVHGLREAFDLDLTRQDAAAA